MKRLMTSLMLLASTLTASAPTATRRAVTSR